MLVSLHGLVSLAFNFILHEKCNYALHYEVLIMCV